MRSLKRNNGDDFFLRFTKSKSVDLNLSISFGVIRVEHFAHVSVAVVVAVFLPTLASAAVPEVEPGNDFQGISLSI